MSVYVQTVPDRVGAATGKTGEENTVVVVVTVVVTLKITDTLNSRVKEEHAHHERIQLTIVQKGFVLGLVVPIFTQSGLKKYALKTSNVLRYSFSCGSMRSITH